MTQERKVKSPAEIAQALEEQVDFMRKYCELYDQGSEHWAKQIASSAYVLCQESPNNKSLLKLAKIRTKNKFLSTSYSSFFDEEEARGAKHMRMPLSMLQLDTKDGIPKGHCIPKLDFDPFRKNHQLSFNEWWKKEEIYRTPSNQPITRQYLVNCMRNTDNSGHFDKLEKYGNYGHLKAEMFGIRISDQDGDEYTMKTNAHLASMRQIGWELDQFFRLSGF